MASEKTTKQDSSPRPRASSSLFSGAAYVSTALGILCGFISYQQRNGYGDGALHLKLWGAATVAFLTAAALSVGAFQMGGDRTDRVVAATVGVISAMLCVPAALLFLLLWGLSDADFSWSG